MKRSFVFGLFVIAIGSFALAQTTANVEQEIRQLEEQMRVATIKGDAAVFERLVADDYYNVNPNGLVRTKAEVIADVKSGVAKTTALEMTNIKVRVYGDAAVLTCDATVKGQLRGARHGRSIATDSHIRQKTGTLAGCGTTTNPYR